MLPDPIIAAAFGAQARLVRARREEIAGSSGVATGSVARIAGEIDRDGHVTPFRMIVKTLAAPSGRHAATANDPQHWSYWRREAYAYASGLLPQGPGLAAPRCFGVIDNVIYLDKALHESERPDVAAARLAAWQASAPIPAVGWLAGDQLAQRLAGRELDWGTVDADPNLSAIWARRDDLLASIADVPRVLTHGDFHAGQVRAAGADTIVLDWGTLGVSPAGTDAAHLALSTLADVDDAYLDEAGSAWPSDGVRRAYRVTLVLTGASRVHWMRSAGVEVPAGYVDFVLAHDPGRA